MFSLKRTIIGGTLAIIALVAVAAAGWWFLIREDNKLATASPQIPKDLPSATAAATSSTGSPTGGSSLAFKIISDRSEAAFFADEKLASLPLPSKAKGTTKDISGQFQLTKEGFGLDPAVPSKFTVNLATLKSDKDMRDRRVQSIALETDKFPTATFTATKVTGFDRAIPAGDEQTLQLTGTMDLHGVQKELTWDVKARRDGNVITGLATVTFKFAEFNIPVLNIANFVSVEDAVTLQATIVAQAG